MSLVFIAEVANSGKYRIRSGAPQGTKRAISHCFSQLLEPLDIPGLSPTLSYSFQNIQHLPGAHPTGHAFAAGLLLGEGKEVASNIYDTTIFI